VALVDCMATDPLLPRGSSVGCWGPLGNRGGPFCVRKEKGLPAKAPGALSRRNVGPNFGPKFKNTGQYSLVLDGLPTLGVARKYGRSNTRRYSMRHCSTTNTIDSKNGNRSAEEKRYFNLAADFKGTFSTQICKPWFVGVWDTGKLDWLVRKSASPAVHKQQSRHRDRPPCHRHRRTTRLLPDKSLDAEGLPVSKRPPRPQAGLVSGRS
jgi:hypothetical protein